MQQSSHRLRSHGPPDTPEQSSPAVPPPAKNIISPEEIKAIRDLKRKRAVSPGDSEELTEKPADNPEDIEDSSQNLLFSKEALIEALTRKLADSPEDVVKQLAKQLAANPEDLLPDFTASIEDIGDRMQEATASQEDVEGVMQDLIAIQAAMKDRTENLTATIENLLDGHNLAAGAKNLLNSLTKNRIDGPDEIKDLTQQIAAIPENLEDRTRDLTATVGNLLAGVTNNHAVGPGDMTGLRQLLAAIPKDLEDGTMTLKAPAGAANFFKGFKGLEIPTGADSEYPEGIKIMFDESPGEPEDPPATKEPATNPLKDLKRKRAANPVAAPVDHFAGLKEKPNASTERLENLADSSTATPEQRVTKRLADHGAKLEMNDLKLVYLESTLEDQEETLGRHEQAMAEIKTVLAHNRNAEQMVQRFTGLEHEWRKESKEQRRLIGKLMEANLDLNSKVAGLERRLGKLESRYKDVETEGRGREDNRQVPGKERMNHGKADNGGPVDVMEGS